MNAQLPPVERHGSAESLPRPLAECIEGYSWPEALRVPIRRLLDLHLECTSGSGAATAGDQAPNPLRRHAVNHLMRWPSSGDPREDEFVRARIGPPRPVVGLHPAGRERRPTAYELDFHGWGVTTLSGPLPSAEARSYVGCLDLLAVDGDARVHPYLPPLRQSQLGEGPGIDPMTIPWPWVSHSTFWGYERAVNWLRLADRQWGGQPDAAFGSWVAVMTAQLFDVSSDPVQPLTRPVRELPCTWTALADRLAELEDTQRCRDWLLAVGLLCTPEMGMLDVGAVPRILPKDLVEEAQDRRVERRSNLAPAARWYVDSWSPVERAVPVRAADRSGPALTDGRGEPDRARAV